MFIVHVVLAGDASLDLPLGSGVWASRFSTRATLEFFISTPVQFGIGWRFYVPCWRSMKSGGLGMDFLVAMGTSASWGYSAFSMALGCMVSFIYYI